MRRTLACLGLIALLGAAANAEPLRNNHADCINGCWRSYEYCKQNQSKKIDCESQLGLCFDFCDDVYLPPMRGDIGGAPADAAPAAPAASFRCAERLPFETDPPYTDASAAGEGPTR